MKSKTLLSLALTCLLAPSLAHAEDLMITLVVDGTLNHAVTGGGSPKFVELYALADVPDLSVYALSRGGNGAALDPLTVDHVLPAVSLSAGDFYYVAGSSFQDYTIPFHDIFPDKTAVRNFGVNSNGDDVTALLKSPSGDFSNADEVIVDVFGELGVDGTGMPWEHIDGYAFSKGDRQPSATFDVNEWIVMKDALDGLDEAGHAAAIPAMQFPVPEPASFCLAMLATTVVLGARRRG